MGWNDDAQMEDSKASKKRGNGSVGKQGGGKAPKAEVLGAQAQAQYSPTVIQIHEALAGVITFEEQECGQGRCAHPAQPQPHLSAQSLLSLTQDEMTRLYAGSKPQAGGEAEEKAEEKAEKKAEKKAAREAQAREKAEEAEKKAEKKAARKAQAREKRAVCVTADSLCVPSQARLSRRRTPVSRVAPPRSARRRSRTQGRIRFVLPAETQNGRLARQPSTYMYLKAGSRGCRAISSWPFLPGGQ